MREEKELVLQAQKGDENAFCALYELYAKKLYNFAMFRLGDPYDAEDAVQNCMLVAFEQITKLKKAEAFSPWLFKTLYCSCVTLIKEQAKKEKRRTWKTPCTCFRQKTKKWFRSRKCTKRLPPFQKKSKT